jgi:hypothetical protein
MEKYLIKIALISIVLLLHINGSFAQELKIYVDNVEITSIENLQYIRVVIVSKGVGTKSKVIVDYGQKINWLHLGNPKIRKSKGGGVKKFNGDIDVLNFFYENGWEYLHYSLLDIGVGDTGFVYLLKRKQT